nr:hypothetical protein [Clostridioides sp.]
MKENLEGFCSLLCLIVSCEMCIAGIQETVHLLAIKEYLGSGLIAIITGLFFWLGTVKYGAIRNHIQKENKDG